MKIKGKDGKFLNKKSAIYKFIERTGGTVDDYYEWATACGIRGSINGKDRMLVEKYGLESVSDFRVVNQLSIPNVGMDADEICELLIQESTNPCDMAACYLQVSKSFGGYSDKDDYIQANLSKFPKASFERWSDKNLISQVSPSWFQKDGIALDVQAEVLTDGFGVEISIQDLVDHVLSYKKGKYVNPKKDLLKRMHAKVEELCGFAVNESYMEHLAQILIGVEVESLKTDDVPF